MAGGLRYAVRGARRTMSHEPRTASREPRTASHEPRTACQISTFFRKLVPSGIQTISRNMDKLTPDIDIVIDLLESGRLVELPAAGFSMFPALRAGDMVIVKPLIKGEMPTPGSIVVCLNMGKRVEEDKRRPGEGERGRWGEDLLVLHRLLEIRIADNGDKIYITRGDSRMEPDLPWPQQQLLGMAVSFKRGKKEHPVKTYIPGEWRYLFNGRLLRVFNKIKRLDQILDHSVKSK
jgi:hypothetical protein